MRLPVRQYFRLLSKYLKPQRARVLLLALLIAASTGLQLLTPQIVRQFIDATQNGTSAAALTRAGLFFLAATVLYQVMRLAAAYVTEDVKWRATNWLRSDLADHCLELDMSFHHEHTPGAMIERIDGDVTELSNFFSQFILQVGANGLLLLGVLIMFILESWLVGAAFLALMLLTVFGLAKTVHYSVPFWSERREAFSQLFGFIEEVLGATEDVRANGGVPYVMRQLQKLIYGVYVATRKAFLAAQITWSLNTVMFAVSNALALGLGGYLFSQGQFTLGTVYLVFHYANVMQRPLEQMARQIQDLQAATAAIGRIEDLLNLEPSVQESDWPLTLPENGPLNVEFDQVTFGYHDADPVLHDLSLELRQGKVLGLLGRTGSGKSTITRLLFRLYDPDSGAIRLDGLDLRHLYLDDIRRSVGMVTQEVQLFQASVRDNLTFFDADLTDSQILAALDALGLMPWYETLDDGLDTELTGGGRGLSAGQGQLLAFTRVFLKDPGLVILDEASSRLDPVTEMMIEKAIDRLLHNRTAIIVAHRLATVQRADEILILQDGEVLEHGDRLALLADPDSHFRQLLDVGLEQVLT